MYEVFEELMKARGLRAVDVSNATGVGQNTLSDWKNGKSVPKADKLQKIANFFGVTMDYLMTGEEPIMYNFDEETAALAQELKTNKELNALMHAARKSNPQYVKAAISMLESFKETNPYG